MKKLYLGSDHAGFQLKEKIKKWLNKKKLPYQDLGNTILDPGDDYPDFAGKVARQVVKENVFGLLLCGSAQGMAIAANKIKGIRAVIPCSPKEACLARQHNNANILCLSGWHTSFPRATRLLEKFLATPFSRQARHLRRLDKIKKLES